MSMSVSGPHGYLMRCFQPLGTGERDGTTTGGAIMALQRIQRGSSVGRSKISGGGRKNGGGGKGCPSRGRKSVKKGMGLKKRGQ